MLNQQDLKAVVPCDGRTLWRAVLSGPSGLALSATAAPLLAGPCEGLGFVIEAQDRGNICFGSISVRCPRPETDPSQCAPNGWPSCTRLGLSLRLKTLLRGFEGWHDFCNFGVLTWDPLEASDSVCNISADVPSSGSGTLGLRLLSRVPSL